MFIKQTSEIPQKGKYDIIVSGGGVAGVAAAVSAARQGLQVLLIEKGVILGGLATQGLVNLFVPMCNGRGKRIISGMAEEFLQLAIQDGYGGIPKEFINGVIPEEKLRLFEISKKKPPRYTSYFSPMVFALNLLNLCVENQVEILFDTLVTEPILEEDKPGYISGVIVENKSGRQFYKAKLFVDTTGDGDLMRRAGILTRERKNYHTYMGLKISLESCKKAVETQNIGKATSWFYGGAANLYGHNHPENTALYDGTDAEDINRYLLRNQLELLEKLRREPRNTRDMAVLPSMVQMRTTRCMEADYILKEEDVFCHFEDSIGVISDFDRRDFLFEVPFRTLVCHKANNLITAGRCAAAQGYAWDVLRVIPPAIITGQAAGIACSQSIKENCPIWGVNIRNLQDELSRQNVLIHFSDSDVVNNAEDLHEFNDC